MSKKNIIILIVAIILFVIALVFFISVRNSEEPVEENNIEQEVSQTKDITNTRYTDITIYNADGTEVKLSQFENQAVMLLFFNENVEDSMTILQKVEEMYGNYKEKINFLMINTAKEVNEKLKDDYTVGIYYDFYEEAARSYNITEVPSMIYINESNEVFNAKAGLTTTDALEANLDILSNNF